MPANNASPGSPQLRKRKTEESADATSDANSESSEKFTEEQLRAVEQIRKCKDYYEILGVPKDAGESELRKQYKKLALQFHPDKNKAPGAVEAFKAIGNAFAVLTDPVKRKRYDTYGLEAMQTTESYPTQERYYYAHSFEGDMTAEEIFNMFFNGPATYVRRGSRWQRYPSHQAHTHEVNNRSTLLQALPLLLMVLVSLLSSMFVSDPAFSLTRTSKYYYERRTNNLDVPYYVKENFLQNYKNTLPKIERQVEDEYIMQVRTSCFRERNYKENMIWRAKHFKDITLETKARDLRTPSCDILNDLYKAYNRH
ncbi:dnaJ homolog subfamily B member 1 [Trichonephila inaurata madagascariensis]|uniref:DnaJ homolog subfamily B member 1 n=1 Tax=Trichonephila inaurata madagascariensis TaxID=2747483 RepID=A0A8X6WMH6_9ARAC|nr:dnaJ homolog subfamily B member 1 [Trichonephila inaurata madagascariensis]